MNAPLPAERTWYTAYCCDCKPAQKVQYDNTQERDGWADVHREHLRHDVQKWSTDRLWP